MQKNFKSIENNEGRKIKMNKCPEENFPSLKYLCNVKINFVRNNTQKKATLTSSIILTFYLQRERESLLKVIQYYSRLTVITQLQQNKNSPHFFIGHVEFPAKPSILNFVFISFSKDNKFCIVGISSIFVFLDSFSYLYL